MSLRISTVIFLLCHCVLWGQNKYEREFRIKKTAFPKQAISLLSEPLKDAKRAKYYKEIDSSKSSFEAKFKKDKLWYSVEFTIHGVLEDVEITIQPLDIPTDTYTSILNTLENMFLRFKIKKIQQQYPLIEGQSAELTIRNAFQNLLVPSINYELIVIGQTAKEYMEFELLFTYNGALLNTRKSFPSNYNHVLY